MPAITYVALRGFEPTGYLKSGSDLSVASGDDSFNASISNLAGLLDNQWFTVSGYANAVNNGWFQANGNSTSSKVTQDTTASLITEAAGPSVVITGYFRGLNQQYSLDFDVTANDRSDRLDRTIHQPKGGGAPEVVFYHDEEQVDIIVVATDESGLRRWREIFASLNSGEQCTFDRYGTIASPSEPRAAVLISDQFQEQRVSTSAFKYRVPLSFRLL